MDSLREDGEQQHSVLVQQQRKEEVREEKDNDSGYEDFGESDQEECVDSHMEGSLVSRGRPEQPIKTPALPQRSDKRASRLLENVMLELQNLDGSKQKEADKISIVQESDPHELYLSSEEDASFSDDYDDSISDFEEDMNLEDAEAARASSSRASSRKSQEDTARIVSFISVGKPQIVDIYVPNISPSTADKRLSQNLETVNSCDTSPTSSPQASTRRSSPLKLYPAFRRMSISSITSLSSPSILNAKAHTYSASTTDLSRMSSNNADAALPPRKSSRLASNLSSLVINTKSSFHSASQSAHTFLYSDPFATPTSSTSTSYIPPSKNTYHSKEEQVEEQTPKSPTSIAAWKKGFLLKARKPSMPKISLAYTAGVVRPRESSEPSSSELHPSIPPPPPTEPEKETSEPIETPDSEPKSLRVSTSSLNTSPETRQVDAKKSEKITYDDIIKAAGEVIPSPTSIPTPKERRGLSFGRLVRTKSGKGRAAKSQLST